jgi:hypothetical protein
MLRLMGMRRSVVLLLVALLTATSSCREEDGQKSSATPLISASAKTAKPVAVAGDVRVVGGPAPGVNYPIPGTVQVFAGTGTSGMPVATASADARGRFSATVPLGTYTFVSAAGKQHYGTACSSPTVLVTGASVPVEVRCFIP